MHFKKGLKALHLRKVGMLALSVMMSASILPSNFVTTHAAEKASDGYTHLGKISKQEVNGNIVTLTYEGGEKAQIKFLNDDMFRFNMEPTGKFLEYPVPRDESHKATIVAQGDDDDKVYSHPNATIAGTGAGDNELVISTAKAEVSLVIDKNTAAMKLVDNTSKKTVWEESESLKYKNNETIQTLKTQTNEYIYGGGVQHGRFTHKGTTLNIAPGGWNDGGSSSPAPFYWSTNGYGVIRNTWQQGTYDFGEANSDKIVTKHSEKRFDSYYFVDPTPVGLLDAYTDITGKANQLPEYAFYLGTLDCYNRDYWDTKQNSAPETEERTSTHGSGNRFIYGNPVQQFERLPAKVKPGNLQDPYIYEKVADSETRETLMGDTYSAKKMISQHEDADIPMAWFLPNDGYGCGYGQTDNFADDLKNLSSFSDYANAHGLQTGLWTQSNLWPKDINNPKKDERDITKEVKEGGIRSIKTDVAWVGAGYSMALNGIEVAHKAISESGVRPNIVTLMGWAGTQRYGGIWTGDQSGGLWEYIRFHIPTYIGSGLSGQPNISSDMDGIYSGGNPIITTRDYQWKAFTPQMLDMDGWGSKQKLPFADGDKYTSINRSYLKLKAELMPYVNTIANTASKDSKPMIRAMMLDYPSEMTYGKLTQYQYMWGDSFLVAPIYEETAVNKAGDDIRNEIYLPKAEGEETVWIDYFTGKQYNGGQLLNNYEAPIWKLPLFVKNGAIIPMYSENNNPEPITADNKKGLDKSQRIIEFYPYGATSFDAYEDDGKSIKGGSTNTTYTSVVENDKATLTAKATTGSYTNMIKDRDTTFIVNVSKAPSAVKGNVAGKDVTFTSVASKEAFDKATTGNVYFYDENPESIMNKYADEGVSFDIKSSPKLYVKSAAKNDISANDLQVVVEGFENDGNLPTDGLNENLAAPVLDVDRAEVTPYSITLNWDAVDDATSYDVEANGLVYTMNTNTSYLLKKLEPDTSYEVRIRSVNKDGYSNWSSQTPVSIKTALDPYRNVAKDLKLTYLNGTVPGGYGGTVFPSLADGDDKTEYSSAAPNAWVNGEFVIDMNKIFTIEKLEYLFRADKSNGSVSKFGLAYSLDNVNWTSLPDWDIVLNDCPVDEKGMYRTATKNFETPYSARYIKMQVKTSVGGYLQGYEIRPYHLDKETGRLLGDLDNSGAVDAESDITALDNHFSLPGKRIGDEHWVEVEKAKFDYNNNGIVDAYELSTIYTKLDGGVTNPQAYTDGQLFMRPSKDNVKAGETFSIDVLGANLQGVNALDFEVSFPNDAVQKDSIQVSGTQATATMKGYKFVAQRENATTAYGAFVNSGEKGKIAGSQSLATIQATATKDMDLSKLNTTHAMLVSSGLYYKNVKPIVLNSKEPNPTIKATTQLMNLTDATQYPTTFKDKNNIDAAQPGRPISNLFDGKIADGSSLDTLWNTGGPQAYAPFTLKTEFKNKAGNAYEPIRVSDIVLYTRIAIGAGGPIEADNLPLTPEGNYTGTPYSGDRVKTVQVKLHTAAKTLDAGTYTFGPNEKVHKIHIPAELQTEDVIRIELVFPDCVSGNETRLNIAEMQVYRNVAENMATGIEFDAKNPTNIISGERADFNVHITPDTAVNKFIDVVSSNEEVLHVSRKVVDGNVQFELEAAKGVSKSTEVTLTAQSLEGLKRTTTITVEPAVIVDKAALETLYNAHKDKVQGNYTNESWADFRSALASAKVVLDKADATQVEVNEAKTALEEAVKNLVVPAVNKAELEALYNANKDKVQGNYTDESWTNFTTALATAKTVLNKADATQVEVNNAKTNLSNAIKNLVEEEIRVDKTELEALYNANKDKVQGSYTDESWTNFTTALATAKTVLNKADATQAEVNNAKTNLSNAITNLVEEGIRVDKTELEALYNANKDKAQGNYTDESWENFTTALATAKTILNKADATQVEVNEAKTGLQKAITNLVENEEVVVDKSMLQALYNANADKQQGTYTDATWKNFTDALANARTTLNKTDATQAEVNSSVDALQSAIDGLRNEVVSIDKSELNKTLKDLEQYIAKEANYTMESFKPFKEAYTKAQAVNENPKATQSEVDKAYEALRTAFAGLKRTETDSGITPPVENEVVKKDDATGIILSGNMDVLDKDSVLKVDVLVQRAVDQLIAMTNANDFFAKVKVESIYNITLTKDNVTVQPNGLIQVRLKLSDEQIASGKTFNILYIADDGSMVDMKAVTKDGYITFNTNHFSNYALISFEGEMPNLPTKAPTNGDGSESGSGTDNNVDTSDKTSLFGYGMLLFIAGGFLVLGKKRFVKGK